jgi:hypothetical protein
MELNPNRIEVASDVSQRDGIGIEVYRENELVVEIFRDDTLKTRVITLYSNEVNLDDMEQYIKVFKNDIPWDFLD